MSDVKIPDASAMSASGGRRLSASQLGAVVEAAYILDAIRR